MKRVPGRRLGSGGGEWKAGDAGLNGERWRKAYGFGRATVLQRSRAGLLASKGRIGANRRQLAIRHAPRIRVSAMRMYILV